MFNTLTINDLVAGMELTWFGPDGCVANVIALSRTKDYRVNVRLVGYGHDAGAKMTVALDTLRRTF